MSELEKKEFKVQMIDDEEDILELLEYNLTKEGYLVKCSLDGISGLEVAREFKPDLVLLDIMMPKQDGVETCRIIRQTPEIQNAFVIFLTARGEEYSEVAAFDAGADDYITKPIKPRALMRRINSVYRRRKQQDEIESVLKFDKLEVDRDSYTVKVSEKTIVLPKKEFELLFFLASKPNKVFGREELLQNIWGSDVYVLARTVDVHIRKVREKIGDGFISTVKGVGYKFEV